MPWASVATPERPITKDMKFLMLGEKWWKNPAVVTAGAGILILCLLVALDQVVPTVELAPLAAAPLLLVSFAMPLRYGIIVACLTAVAFSLVDADTRSWIRHLNDSVPLDAAALAVGFVTIVAVADYLRHQSAAAAKVAHELELTKSSESHHRFLALHDPVTKVANRLMFDDRLKVALQKADGRLHNVALVLVDLDRFKAVNDEYGHLAGDDALAQVAAGLSSGVRRDDTIARIGGDEFAIIIEKLESPAEAARIAAKVAALFPMPVVANGQPLKMHASVGFSVYPNDGRDVHRLVDAADASMDKNRHLKTV